MQIKVTIQSDELERKLQQLTSKLKNLKPLMGSIGAMMLEDTEDNFESESFMGRPWKPWGASTKKRRAGGKKLQDSTHLAGSITYDADSSSVALGTNVVYGAIHQFGGRAGRAKASIIPARPFLPIVDGVLPPGLEADIYEEVNIYLSLI